MIIIKPGVIKNTNQNNSIFWRFSFGFNKIGS